MHRSDFLKTVFGVSAGLMATRSFGTPTRVAGPFTLAPLPYDAAALEPHIDKKTMGIHHDKHHQAYVDNLNKAVAGTDMAKMSIDDLVRSIGATTPAAVRNNAGGHWNHTFFWTMLSAKGGGVPTGPLGDAITKKFGSFEAFKTEWAKAATSRFGSGWVWLIKNGSDIEITTTPNQDNPLMALAEKKGTPLMGLDVWEHAYYLKYENRRPEYVQAAFNVFDWNKASSLYAGVK